MARILNIETATLTCSVALGVDGECQRLKEVTRDHFSHAEELTLLIRELMKEEGLRYEQLDAIAVGSGPGSYTGLRIGVSTAKGSAYALGRPLLSIPTLRIMAKGFAQWKKLPEGDRIVPMIDARRKEVFSSVHDGKGEILEKERALILEEESFGGMASVPAVHFIGSGAEKAEGILKGLPNAMFHPDLHPSAQNMVNLTEMRYQEGLFEDLFAFEPFYLKDFVPTTPKKG